MHYVILCNVNQLQGQAKQSEEQAKKMEEKTEQLAGEVASLREALEKLVTQLAAKWNYNDCAINTYTIAD